MRPCRPPSPRRGERGVRWLPGTNACTAECLPACRCACLRLEAHGLSFTSCLPACPPARLPACWCRQEAESVFEQVCQLEAEFWQMAYSATTFE
jgi:hypothetical protein